MRMVGEGESMRTYVLDVPVAGMDTVCQEEAQAFAKRISLEDGGCEELLIVLSACQNTPHQNGNLAVMHDGSTIGYLVHGFPGAEHLRDDGTREAPMLVFGRELRGTLRLKAWVWGGGGEPEWPFSADIRPPMNPTEKADYDLQQSLARIKRYSNGDPDFIGSVRSGTAHIGSYSTFNLLAQLAVKSGRMDEALFFIQASLEGVSQNPKLESMIQPTTYRASLVLRKLKREPGELAVLEWWASATDPIHLGPTNPGVKRLLALRKRGVTPEPFWLSEGAQIEKGH